MALEFGPSPASPWRAPGGNLAEPVRAAHGGMRQGNSHPYPGRDEIDQTAMAAHPSYLTAGPGCRWLMLAAEMAGLVNGDRWPAPDPVPMGQGFPPRIATRLLGADPGSVRAARDFTVATLHRWGAA